MKTVELNNKPNGLLSKLVTGIVGGLVVFVLFFLWGDVKNVKQVIVTIPVGLFLLAITSTLVSYLIRFYKWQSFLKQLDIRMPFSDNICIFFIGLSMSITPGKLGELLKSYLLKKRGHFDIPHSAPAIFADRLTDMLAMLLLIAVGGSLFSFGYVSLIIAFASVIVFVVILQSRTLSIASINYLTRIKRFSNYREPVLKLYESTYILLQWKSLLGATMISVVAWGMECISLYILITALDINLALIQVVLIFSLGTVAGALSMLPGGLGVAEGSITGMLMYFHIAKTLAVSITLLIRLVTLWLGVIIGLAILITKRKRYML